MPAADQVLHWAPRVLGVLFAAFISLFALDVFGEGEPPGRMLAALAMHLIPTALIVAALLVAWRWPAIGGVVFLGVGAAYVVASWGRFPWLTYLIIAGPPALIGLLLIADHIRQGQGGWRGGAD